MKKLSALLLGVIFLASCASYVNSVKGQQSEKSGKVYLIGKITFNPEPKQELKNLGSGQWKGVFAGNFSNKMEIDEKPTANFSEKWGEYFIWEIPRADIYLKCITLVMKADAGDTVFLNYHTFIPFKFEKDDVFIYIGDITITEQKNEMGGRDTVLKVADNSKYVSETYAKTIKGSGGNFIVPKTKLIESKRIKESAVSHKVEVY
ncbi:MAG TPA: hypothetical protein PK624_11520 [Spirochaetota bacterium]|nr:hypothetical protein [Spirochaetota bacterium]HPK57118.1 hypothetical protein [Spirochaetota bacterium]